MWIDPCKPTAPARPSMYPNIKAWAMTQHCLAQIFELVRPPPVLLPFLLAMRRCPSEIDYYTYLAGRNQPPEQPGDEGLSASKSAVLTEASRSQRSVSSQGRGRKPTK